MSRNPDDYSLADLPRHAYSVPRRQGSAQETRALLAECTAHDERLQEEREAVEEVLAQVPDTITARTWRIAGYAWLALAGVMTLGHLALLAVEHQDLYSLGMLTGAGCCAAGLALAGAMAWLWRKWTGR